MKRSKSSQIILRTFSTLLVAASTFFLIYISFALGIHYLRYIVGVLVLLILLILFSFLGKIKNAVLAGCVILGLLNLTPLPFEPFYQDWGYLGGCTKEQPWGVGMGFPSQIINIPFKSIHESKCAFNKTHIITAGVPYLTNDLLIDTIYFLFVLPSISFIYATSRKYLD